MDSPDAIRHETSDASADVGLVARMLAGETHAHEDVTSRLECVPRIAAWLNQRISSPLTVHELQDVVQNSALVIWRKLPEFEGRASLETWVYRIVRFELLNEVRRKQRSSTRTVLDHDALAEATVPEELEDSGDEKLLMIESLGRLDERKRSVIELKHFETLTFPQIGERLGISENTARTRYYRGLREMRESLEARRRRAERRQD